MLTENVARAIPGKYAVPYTTAKYALLGLMKCLAAEYADKGITVNGVSPSMIETNFVSGLPELSRQLNAAQSPMKRNLSVDDVTPMLEYLLSDSADMVTGQNFAIMGGNG
jgi:3-oxoacyl-[acyl-carrier protein] reductase